MLFPLEDTAHTNAKILVGRARFAREATNEIDIERKSN
jgi:hypothetical protein